MDWKEKLQRRAEQIGTLLFFSKWSERLAIAAIVYTILVFAIQIGVAFQSGAVSRVVNAPQAQIVEGQ